MTKKYRLYRACKHLFYYQTVKHPGLIDAYTLLTEKTDAEKEKLLKRLKAERLKDQYCFKTAKAITLLNEFGNVKRKEFECYQKQIDSI